MSDAYELWGLFSSPLIQSSHLQWNTHTLEYCTQSEPLQFSLLNNNYQSSPHEYRVCRSHIVSAYAISGTYRRTLISQANLVRLITMLPKNRIKPWDIFSMCQIWLLTTIICCFLMSHEDIQCSILSDIPCAWICFPNLLWRSESNALLKSNINDIDWMALLF